MLGLGTTPRVGGPRRDESYASLEKLFLLDAGVAPPKAARQVTAVVGETKGAPRELKLLQNGEEPSARYVDSPRTRAEMERVQQKAAVARPTATTRRRPSSSTTG